MKIPQQPWWMTDEYDRTNYDGGLDLTNESLWGPRGPAVTELFPDGRTGPGWGSEAFMKNYEKLVFSIRRLLYKYEERKQPFAFIMRSARMVCVDIDGKNGGFDHASELGFLPPTTSERSMSGNGYHLFYETEDVWDDGLGYAMIPDYIGIVTGVDIRGTGCVFHKPTQAWNDRPLAPLPQHLKDRLLKRAQIRAQQVSVIQKTLELDTVEVLMMQNELITELNKPIPKGKRNQSLFAIGTQMKQAQIKDWDQALGKRAGEVGLDDDEIEKLITNIDKYGA